MLSVSQLIAQVRRDTNNLSNAVVVSSTEGIQDIDFINALNRAQERLQAVIIGVNVQAFTKESFIDVVANTAEYPIPDDAFFKQKLVTLEYSSTGSSEDYCQLNAKSLKERNNTSGLYVDGYILRNAKIILDPKPSTSVPNGVRLNYVYRLPALDIPRAAVSAVTLDAVNRNITALTVTVSGDVAMTGDNLIAMQAANYLSVVDRYGTIKMNKIPLIGIDSSTGVLTIPLSFAYQVNQTLSVGDLIVTGYDASSFCQLSDDTERFLQVFANRYVFRRDSSDDIVNASEELKELLDDIVTNWTDLSEDVEYITILDHGMIP